MPLAKARSTQIHSVQPYQFYLTVVWGWNKKMIPAEWNYVERIISPIYGLKKRKNLICKFYKIESEAEFKKFEPRLKFKLRLKYGWFHLKLYSILQDLSRRSIETGFGGIWDAA